MTKVKVAETKEMLTIKMFKYFTGNEFYSDYVGLIFRSINLLIKIISVITHTPGRTPGRDFHCNAA